MSDWHEAVIFEQLKGILHEIDFLSLIIAGLLLILVIMGGIVLYHFW